MSEETLVWNWRKPTELPKDEQMIVILEPHWKMIWPGSLLITGYEYREFSPGEPTLINHDDHGQGSYAPHWGEVAAWMPADEFVECMPEFLKWEK